MRGGTKGNPVEVLLACIISLNKYWCTVLKIE